MATARSLLAILLLGLVLVGCNGRIAHPGLATIAQNLAEADPSEADLLSLTVAVVETDRQPKLRCQLRNLSVEPVTMEEAELPCRGWWSLQVVGLAIDGRVLQVKVGAGSILVVSPPPKITIRPGETLEGLLDLKSVYPLDTNSRDSDVLLLWCYLFRKRAYTGVALLPKAHG